MHGALSGGIAKIPLRSPRTVDKGGRIDDRLDMVSVLELEMSPQPDDTTCGPTCLDAVYSYYGDHVPLSQVIAETGRLREGGTLAVFLGCHALRRGYDATIYTYNLQVFDPTWFREPQPVLSEKLKAQRGVKTSSKLRTATDAYLEYLELGGMIRMEVLTIELIRRYLKRGIPILTGLSATFLYWEKREYPPPEPPPGRTTVPDDVRGLPAGHFVVLCGYDADHRTVLVADPLDPNPIATNRLYAVDIDRVFAAIMLGIVTYDANLLIIQPRKKGVLVHARHHRG